MSVPETPVKLTRKQVRAAHLVAADELPDREIAQQVGISERQLERWKQQPEFQARVQEDVTAFRESIRERGIAVLENRIVALDRRHQLLEQVRRERGASPEMQGIPGGSTGLLIRRGKLVKVFEPIQAEIGPGEVEEGDLCPSCGAEDDEGPRLRIAEVRRLRTGDAREALVCPVCIERWRDTETLASAKLSETVYEYELDTGMLKALLDIERQTAQELGQWRERKEVDVRDVGIAEALDRKLAGLVAEAEAGGVLGEPDAEGEG